MIMNLFTRLPITLTDTTYPVVSEAEIDYFTDYEPASYEHWIFNKGNSANLIGVNNSKVLTPQAEAPVYGTNYLENLIYPAGKALLTDYADTVNAKDTVCMVVNDSDTSAGIHQLWGNRVSESVGGSPLFSGVSPLRKLWLGYSGVHGGGIATGLSIPSTSSWYFVAVSRNFALTTKTLIGFIGGQTAYSYSGSGTYAPGTAQVVSLGSPNYTTASIAKSFNKVAEFIIFDKALTAAEIQAVYLRRKAKLASIGIAVV